MDKNNIDETTNNKDIATVEVPVAEEKSGGCCGSGGCSSGGCSSGGCSSGGCMTCAQKGSCGSVKLDVIDWLHDIPEAADTTDLIEVQFKNTRKGYFRNSNQLRLQKGDVIAVESSPGHDIGTITLTGELVLHQMRKSRINLKTYEFKRVYRKAKPNDLEKWKKAQEKEHKTMLRSRVLAEDLKLEMKIGDVEYQGDGNKAIFYYIADERVDFRQLIKVLAEEFRVRIEMKQIGARQEAGRIGGIGSCGRELCCSKWKSGFESVSTNAARVQELSLNPQKLAGQCGKLKCCINYEVDSYVEASNKLPDRGRPLETSDGTFYHMKTDIFQEQMTYSSDPYIAANVTTLSSSRVAEIQRLNRRGKKVDTLKADVSTKVNVTKRLDYENVVGQDDINRFDNKNKKVIRKKRRKPRRRRDGGEGGSDQKG